MAGWHSIFMPEQQCAGQVASQMIHFRFEIFAVDQFTDIDVMFLWRFLYQMFEYTVDGGLIIANNAVDVEWVRFD